MHSNRLAGWSVEVIAKESGCSSERAETVLAALQGLSLLVCLRDLAECLKIKLMEINQFSLIWSASDNLEQLGRESVKQLAHKFKCTRRYC